MDVGGGGMRGVRGGGIRVMVLGGTKITRNIKI